MEFNIIYFIVGHGKSNFNIVTHVKTCKIIVMSGTCTMYITADVKTKTK